jgi:oxygen-dependent protoporphyrinogen oxidase
VLLRTMYGGALDPGAINLSDRELLDQFMKDLGGILQLKKMPEFVRIYRWNKAIPQYTLDHGKRLRGIEQAEGTSRGWPSRGTRTAGWG